MLRHDPRRLRELARPRPAPAERVAELAERGDALDTMLAWERYLTGRAPAGRPIGHFVVSSWRRSLAFGVNPGSRAAPLVARDDDVAALRERHRTLLSAAAGILSEAAELFVGSRLIMLLTDPDGVVLEVTGDGLTLEQGQDIHLMQGGAWAESLIGTNGIGTAIATRRPAQVHAAEHFCEGIKRWTCAAAPIFAPGSDELLGVIDISGPPATYQRSHLALAVTTARQIETVLGERAAQTRLRLLEACLQRMSSADAAGLVALDRDGRLVHVGGGVRPPVEVGERLPGLSQGLPVEDWAQLLPEGWRPEWFNPVADRGETIGAVLVIPSRPRLAASRGGSESDPQRSGFHHIIGDSPVMAALIARARKLAARRVAVLIEGETGTGKELLARALHGGEGPFIAFNCGAVSHELLGGELFGHIRGAFTGATSEGRAGRFELAHQGTLCLDEIGELPRELQPVLLRALEEGVIYRLGDAAPRRVDVRLIAITNRNLRDEVEAGRFRRDLYYRIAVTTLTVPPLRVRTGDVDLLVNSFLRLLAGRHGLPNSRFTPSALAALRAYAWPGNVRELRNAIETAMLTATGPELGLGDLPVELREQPEVQDLAAAAETDSLAAAERQAIERAVAGSQGNLAEAARHLGISRSTLYRKLELYHLKA